MIDWILNQGEKNALKDIINISGKNLNISRLTVCTTPKYQFSKLHYDYVSKYPDSYEIHTEVLCKWLIYMSLTLQIVQEKK